MQELKGGNGIKSGMMNQTPLFGELNEGHLIFDVKSLWIWTKTVVKIYL
jgi:hypothetical protein